MDHGDSLKGNLFFAAGRAAASRGWFDAVLVTGSEVLNVSPVGPPVVVVIQGRGLDLEEAKALASALKSTGILLKNTEPVKRLIQKNKKKELHHLKSL